MGVGFEKRNNVRKIAFIHVRTRNHPRSQFPKRRFARKTDASASELAIIVLTTQTIIAMDDYNNSIDALGSSDSDEDVAVALFACTAGHIVKQLEDLTTCTDIWHTLKTSYGPSPKWHRQQFNQRH